MQELTFGTQKVELHTPAVLSVGAGIGAVRLPSLKQKLQAKSKKIEVLCMQDLKDKNPESYGLKASPTQVCHIKEANFKAKAPILSLEKEEAAEKIFAALTLLKEGN